MSVRNDPSLLNLAMNLSLEFGESWRQSITRRLVRQRPDITQPEAEELDRSVREARDWAHELIAKTVSDKGTTETALREQIRKTCPWIDDDTLERLWNQGLYYAMKR